MSIALRAPLFLAAALVFGTAFAQEDAPPAPTTTDVAQVAETPAAPAVPAASAAPALSQTKGENVSVTGSSARTVWAAGSSVDVDATAPDAFLAGDRVTLRGHILDNLTAAGRTIAVDGPVGGDAFLFGETLRLSSDVGGDVYAMGESLTIPKGVAVGGNVYFAGAELDMEGSIGGSLLGGGADIDIDGSVGGDVKLEAANVHLGPGASVGGDFSYESPKKGDISPQAAVGGTVLWTEKVDVDSSGMHADKDDGDSILGGLLWRGFAFLASLLVGGVLLGLFPRAILQPAAILEEELQVSLGIGFALLLGVPVLALFLMLFVLPIPLSLLTLAVYVPATFLARFIAAYVLGNLALERMGQAAKPMGALVVGIALLQVVYLVPFLGALVATLATVVGLGALFLAARRASGNPVA